MKKLYQKLLNTDQAKTTLLIRLLVGAVFVSEGLQKFLFPELRGSGRFASIGLPAPELLGSWVGGWEILAGFCVLIGLWTRKASIPLLIIMLVAIFTTKSTVLAEKGFWEMMHGSRTDWSMLLGSLFLLIKGGGAWSVDGWMSKKLR